MSEGVCRDEAKEILAPFARWITTGRPFVTLKLGMTLDGRIADAAGASRWITGPRARAVVQRLRRSADAILVGRETVARDDPALLPRPDHRRRPWRVVVARGGGVPLTARLLNDVSSSRTIIAVAARCPPARERALRAKGAEVLRLPADSVGVDVRALLAALGERGVLHVLCEGGGALAASLVRAGAVDAYEFFVAPRLLGAAGAAAVGGGWPLAEMPALRWRDVRPLGRDLWIRAWPKRPSNRQHTKG